MPTNEKVFAFDVGKASLGICAREGSHILDLQSLLIPVEFAATSDFRNRRRACRTRDAHKKREEWLCRKWREVGLIPLASDDTRMTREFPKKSDNTLCNSALLRIALLQSQPLQEWQIFKALRSSIQLRGYDANLPWARNYVGENAEGQTAEDQDEKENREGAQRYRERLQEAITPYFEYEYPCFLEASLMGLWQSETPDVLKSRIDHQAQKVRRKPGANSGTDPGNVAPRDLVEKEIRALLGNAKKQLPQLQSIDIDEWLYGESRQAYASYRDIDYKKYRGSEWDAQGLLSQKVPRFDNRILNKCQMLPKRNVCKANETLSLQFNLLMKLKNIRFTDDDGVVGRFLSCEELTCVYDLCQENLSEKKTQDITFGNLVKFIEKATGGRVMDINLAKGEKIKLNASGRSRFCRPALTIMNRILLEGSDPPTFDLAPYIQDDKSNGINREELAAMVSRLGETWQGFHLGDKRYIDLETALQTEGKEKAILKLIGSVNNPVVRHRLTIFWNELKKMAQRHGTPDRVILEFVRGGEGLDGQKTANDWEKSIKDNEKRNDRIREQLEEQGLKTHKWNIERFKMAEEQQWQCPYTGERLEANMLAYYQVDHIVPVSVNVGDTTTDAFYNKVLCTTQANNKKAEGKSKTPYEWLGSSDHWPEFLARITDKNSRYSKKKKELLIRNDSRELVESYNGLAETAYIARLAQQIVGLQFGWGLQTRDDNRRVFVNDGKMTAKIRKIYSLNELLLTDEDKAKLSEAKDAGQQRTVWKKNRENPKHHALDAYCISYSQNLKIDRVDEAGRIHWHVPSLMETKAQMERKLMELFPENIRRDKKRLYPEETFYKVKDGRATVKKMLVELLGDKRDGIDKIKIIDEDIKAALKDAAEKISDKAEWRKFLESFTHPKRKSRVRRVEILVSENTDEYGEYGLKQFKRPKANQGQILYQDAKGNWKVQQVYPHTSMKPLLASMRQQGFTLYRNGMVFSNGCLIWAPEKFQAEKQTIRPAGRYIVKTIKTNRQINLETSDGQEFLSNIKYLVEAGFELAEYHDKTVKVLSSTSD